MGMDKKIETKKWPAKRIAVYGLICVGAVLIIYMVTTATGQRRLNVKKEQITISQIEAGDFQELIAVRGNVMPENTIFLDAESGGRVEEIYLEAGATVEEGDEILKLGNTNLLLDIMYREAELFQQSNNLRNTRLAFEQNRLSLKRERNEINYRLKVAKRQLRRKEGLYKSRDISTEEYENIKDEYDYLTIKKDIIEETIETDELLRNEQVEQLEGSLQRMEENLRVVKTKLDYLTLKAPISGQLTAFDLEIGQTVGPGQRIGKIDVIGSFKVVVQIDEHYIEKITSGGPGRTEIGEKSYALTTSKVYPEVQGGQFKIEMHFKGDPPDELRRGQTLHIKLELGDVNEAVLVERGGFYQETGGNWIFVVDETGQQAVRRDITLGRYNPSHYEVVSGLVPGEQVVTSSYDSFGDAEILILE